MLTAICAEIRNYFSLKDDKIIGDFSVTDGAITPSVGLADDQYYRVVGSIFNDGVHRADDILKDEGDFHGAVWKMRVPQDVLDLADEIAAWQAQNGSTDSVNMSPFTSESFGGYSYSKSSGGGTGDGGAGASGVTWQTMFAKRLNPYRRARVV